MDIILIFIIAISLSMDAFSLALAYGTISMRKKEIKALSAIVGLYHFIMPILGMLFGRFILNFIHIGSNLIVLLIFVFIGLNMVFESLKERQEVKSLKLSDMILFGFAVSIDSFSVGVGINGITNNYLLSSFAFFIVSFIFTYIGLFMGNKLNKLTGKLSTLIGGLILIVFALVYYFN